MSEIIETYLTGKPICYVDMDGVVVDWVSTLGANATFEEKEKAQQDEYFWRYLKPVKHSIPALKWLDKSFDIFILSTAPWDAPVAWTEKRIWVENNLLKEVPSLYKRVILSHFKQLNMGDYLIDDRLKNGAGDFKGELIQFGSEGFEDWVKVCIYLAKKANAF